MDAPPVEPIVPLAPVDPPVTPQEVLAVLGEPSILENIAGKLPLRDQRRLERVSSTVRQAAQEVGERRRERLEALTTDPRTQQLTRLVRGHLRQPMVRSGFIPGVDYAPAMQGPQTDAELLTEALGDFAEVTPEDRWSGVLDRRWMAINTNDDAASRPHLVDRRGRAIDRGRDDEVPPLTHRRVEQPTPYAYLRERGIRVVPRGVSSLPPPQVPPAA